MPNAVNTLRELIRRPAQECPEQNAVVDGTCRLDYAALHDRVRRMAKLLHAQGVRKGDRVALLMPPSAAHLIALFGAIELGAIPAALHVRESDPVLLALLEQLSPRAFVYDQAFAPRARKLRAQCAYAIAGIQSVSTLEAPDTPGERDEPLIPDDLGEHPPDFEAMPVGPGDTAVIALSSGTTGLPKGVMHTHRTLLASARCGAHYVAARPGAVGINTFTTAFIGWYNCTLPFLYGASKIVYLARWEPRNYLEAIGKEKATVCFLVPTMWRMLLKEAGEADYDFSSLELVGYAGEPMDSRTLSQLRKKICSRVMNTYGTTESGSWGGCTVMLPDDPAGEERLESVGRPGMEVEIRIVRPGGATFETLAAGEEGEILISGPSVASQLWERPALSQRIFDSGWWRSGDMGCLDEEGYLFLRGRVDDMIISGGINVFPAEIEDLILRHPGVSECAVIGLPSNEWGQQITAFVVVKAGLSEQELRAHIEKTGLSGYKRPREYRFVENLPRGNTGKVSRKRLRDKVLEG